VKKIRILYTIPNFDTAGSGRLLLSLMEKLDKSVFDLQICCFHTRGAFFSTVERSGFPVHVYNFVADMSNRLKGVREAFRIARFFRTLDVDIIHSFHYTSDYSEALAARLAGCKWVYTKKNMSWYGKCENGWKLRTWLAHGVVAQNTDMLGTFFRNRKNVVMIPSAVDMEEFAHQTPDPALRGRFDTPDDKRIVVTVANLVPVKGLEVLISAFSRVASQFPSWMLWIVGDHNNEYGRFLQELCKQNGIEDKTRFLGWQLDVRKCLDHAEIFVIPTLDAGRREGSPVALLEAMANDKVVLASDISGIRDQLNTFPSHLFSAGDISGLAAKLTFWMEQSVESNRVLGKRFGQHVSQHYSTATIAAKYEGFYRRILGEL